MNESPIARALREVFISPNVSDSNGEDANLVDVIQRLALAARADSEATTAGAREIGAAIDEAGRAIASAIESLAAAVRWAGTPGGS